MTEMITRQSRPGRSSMVQSTGRLVMLGLACCALRVCARVDKLASIVASRSSDPPSVIKNFEASGTTEVMRSFVRMTPDEPNQLGALWSMYSLSSKDLSLEWKFRIGGGKQEEQGGTFALIISRIKQEGGRFFGIDENFTGLAVIVNTDQQPPLAGRRPGHPPTRHRDVVIVANNGTRSYDDLMANLDGCTAIMKPMKRKSGFDHFRSSRIRLRVKDNKAMVDVDAGDTGRWRRCVTKVPMEIRPNSAYRRHVGIIAQTSERSMFQDLFGLQVYTDPDGAWNTDIYSEKLKETNVLNQRTRTSGRRNLPTPKKHHAEPMRDDTPMSIREERVIGTRALKEACSDSVEFARCHHDRGSAVQLEKCLTRRGRSVSARCIEGIDAWKSLLIETAPGARNMPPALDDKSAGERGSSHAHAAKSRSKKNNPPLTGSSPVDKRAVSRGISKNDRDNKRTTQVHRTPVALKPRDVTKSSSPGKSLRREQDDGRRGARLRNREQKQHAPHSGGPSRSHHRNDKARQKELDEDELSSFIRYLFLALIVVLVVKRAAQRLAQHINRHRVWSGDDAPGGNQALPEDDAAAALAMSVAGQQRDGAASAIIDGDYVNDNDAIVAVGTPVNPPPSVHL